MLRTNAHSWPGSTGGAEGNNPGTQVPELQSTHSLPRATPQQDTDPSPGGPLLLGVEKARHFAWGTLGVPAITPPTPPDHRNPPHGHVETPALAGVHTSSTQAVSGPRRQSMVTTVGNEPHQPGKKPVPDGNRKRVLGCHPLSKTNQPQKQRIGERFYLPPILGICPSQGHFCARKRS